MRRLPTALVAGLLLLAGCSAPVTTASADAGGDDPPAVDAGPAVVGGDDPTARAADGRLPQVAAGAPANATTITVSAAGHATAAPDHAVVRFAVTATADGPDAARGAVATDVGRVRTALRDAGVPDDAVRTTAFAVTPEYRYVNGTRELVGYRAVHAVAVETAPDDAGRIVDVALGNGADEVADVFFGLADGTRAALRSEALGRAVAAARADADAVAGAAGLGVTGVAAVEVSDDVAVPTAAAREGAAGDGTTFDPGPVTVTARVRVTYAAA
ncbi:MAG: SIMPL domain-containing protein [Haloferacaceae archaeon]